MVTVHAINLNCIAMFFWVPANTCYSNHACDNVLLFCDWKERKQNKVEKNACVVETWWPIPELMPSGSGLTVLKQELRHLFFPPPFLSLFFVCFCESKQFIYSQIWQAWLPADSKWLNSICIKIVYSLAGFHLSSKEFCFKIFSFF